MDINDLIYSSVGNNQIMWYIVLKAFPLSGGKEKAIKRNIDRCGGRRNVVGILMDHLIKVARNVGIPNIYIKEFVNARKYAGVYRGVYRGIDKEATMGLSNLKYHGNNLLNAVFESVYEGTFKNKFV